MYIRSEYALSEPRTIAEIVRAHPFALLIGVHDGAPVVSHVPLVLDERPDGSRRLLGHVARGNPQVRTLTDGAPILAVFSGPDAYVSPRFYANPERVPTWNYLAVHARGRVRSIDDLREATDVIRALCAAFERGPDPFRVEELDEELVHGMMRGIRVFAIEVERFEAKAKLSQDKPPDDQRGVVRALSEGGPDERATAAWMRRLLGI